MEGVLLDLDSAEAEGRVELIRDFNGNLEVGLNAASLVRGALASPAAVEAIGATGVSLADANGDGLPDSAEQIAAVYEFIAQNGIPGEGGHALLRPDQVEGALYVDGNTQATRLEVYLPKIFDDANVLETRAILEEKVADLETDLAGVEMVAMSGGAILTQNTLDAFTGSMLKSLPIAILLTVLIALLVMRSVRYALITMVPILLVVTWVYGFMYVADYKINVITATIAAIAIGVGIDFATHFTVRFREEFEGEPSRFPALRRAGEGTGGALAISALTSITGFLVMASAPMPMFAVFGALTAVMIFFALLVSLLVLPSLLLLVTPSRKGEEREELEEAITRGEFEYKQHARETADLRHPHHGLKEELEGEDAPKNEMDE
jgi:hypothetical protein